MSPGAPPRTERPYFFLSHANTLAVDFSGVGETDAEMMDFFHLLCRHLRQLTTVPVETSPGFIDRTVRTGTEWRAGILQALALCQVFVPLYSPRYFDREWCGWEWDGFRRRERAHRSSQPLPFSAIVPVLWTDARSMVLPRCAAELQYADSRLGEAYQKLGIYGLIYEDVALYQKVAFRIACRIRDVAEATRLRPCAPSLFDDPVDAFEEGR